MNVITFQVWHLAVYILPVSAKLVQGAWYGYLGGPAAQTSKGWRPPGAFLHSSNDRVNCRNYSAIMKAP